ncbi:MAG: iron-containing alcohol dehydrogenase [Candidatus Heimdallarchaeota archaeon]|nr:iron-containing alcohol dehydrogenase [Candidatus Heimdallarchaeota archaeon]
MNKNEVETTWYESPALKGLVGLMGGRAMRGIMNQFRGNRIFGGKTGLMDVAEELGKRLEPNEKRLLIIADSFTQRFSKKIQPEFEQQGFEIRIWDGVKPEVPLDIIEEGVEICKEFKPTIFVAVGGGSVIDAAKVLWIAYERPEIDLLQIDVFSSVIGLRTKVIALVAIPTTIGTGSEVTTAAVVTDTRREPPKKISLSVDETLPDYVVLDTDFVKTLPPFLIKATGLDALAHSIGAYVSNWGSPFIDAINMTAIKEVLQYLPRLAKFGTKDLEALEHMQWAATLAGMGFINAMPGIDHALGHSFGAVMHVHHGLSVGMFAAQSVAWQAQVTERWRDLCPLFGIDQQKYSSRQELLEALVRAIQDFCRSIGGVAAVKEIEKPKITQEDYLKKIEVMAEYADSDVCSLTSYRPINKEIYKQMYQAAWDGEELIY